jgi:threonylcarbamoyladenosine tRNA methylthiotransferase MtaB
LGCKLNQAEAEGLTRRFVRAGYTVVDPDAGPDVYVLNTCTVTHIADRKSRQALRRDRRANPEGAIVATGCYAQRAADDLKAMPEVDFVVDNTDKARLLQVLGLAGGDDGDEPFRAPGRTRSMVKIQEGCNQVCAYCIVPKTRGRERSVPIDDLVAQVRGLVSAGYREVVLTGTQLGSYGYEFESPSPGGSPLSNGSWYETLVRRILGETEIERLRMSSLQPQEITDGMIELYDKGRLCLHVHMPLQSGSDDVLQRMRRRYDTAVGRLRAVVPDIGITTDIIIGFPGETSEEFEASFRFAQSIGFSAIHVFPYSRRPGTTASFLPDHIDAPTKRDREQRFLALARQAEHAYNKRFTGRTALVLWENRKESSDKTAWTGLTESYVRAFTRSPRDLANQILDSRLTGEAPGGLWAELADPVPDPGLEPRPVAP